METVSNLTAAASRVIFGDSTKDNEISSSNQEPLSGELGNVEAGEPYDKGNLENEESALSTMDLPSRPAEHTNMKSTDNVNVNLESEPVKDMDSIGVTSPTSGPLSDMPALTDENMPSSNTSVNAENTATLRGGEKIDEYQGAESATTEVKDGSVEHKAIQETKNEIEVAANTGALGSGPRAVDGEAKPDLVSTALSDSDDKPAKHIPDGTEEKSVESTGMKADGGNFDAAKPGAAKEADRLLEAKELEQSVSPGKVSEDSKSSSKGDTSKESGGVKEKMSIMKEKIKAKLHKN